MLTAIAVILLGLWLVFTSQQHLSSTLTLVWGIVVVVLVLVDLAAPYWRGSPRAP